MDEQDIRITLYLADNPHNTGKKIADETKLSESNVSKRLNNLKKDGIVDNKTCSTQNGKNYSGKCWYIVKEPCVLEKLLDCLAYTTFLPTSYCESMVVYNNSCASVLTETIRSQQDECITKIRNLATQYEKIENVIPHSDLKYNKHESFGELLWVLIQTLWPSCGGPGNVAVAISCSDLIFELQQTYYDREIAPYKQAIEDARTRQDRDKAIKDKEDMDRKIITDLCGTTPKIRLLTDKEIEWLEFTGHIMNSERSIGEEIEENCDDVCFE